ncbi:MAG: hypothetical protein C5B50_29600 [Verrucomicrobia bacterium]|nr:MAG: hypothetical protein C5B50_29600 [Verrucomicrobiota bacterium]
MHFIRAIRTVRGNKAVMKRHTKLTSEEKEVQQTAEQQTQASTVREFATVEEMLREDAAGTSVPTAIAHRLHDSISPIPAPPRPWWRRLFGS